MNELMRGIALGGAIERMLRATSDYLNSDDAKSGSLTGALVLARDELREVLSRHTGKEE